MDEPEGALSYYNQYVLMNMIADAVKRDCQFIISTHSPVLLAYPEATLYSFEESRLRESSFPLWITSTSCGAFSRNLDDTCGCWEQM